QRRWRRRRAAAVRRGEGVRLRTRERSRRAGALHRGQGGPARLLTRRASRGPALYPARGRFPVASRARGFIIDALKGLAGRASPAARTSASAPAPTATPAPAACAPATAGR